LFHRMEHDTIASPTPRSDCSTGWNMTPSRRRRAHGDDAHRRPEHPDQPHSPRARGELSASRRKPVPGFRRAPGRRGQGGTRARTGAYVTEEPTQPSSSGAVETGNEF
jgi:hypothetical protein